jgi:hypothetical protein
MSDRAIPRVTFDTNVCNVINNPTKWPALVAPDDAQKIRAAISDGRIAGFVSEATLFVECLSFPDKLTYLSVAGTPDARPAPDPRMVAIFDDLAAIGMELLHAPLIGAEKFVESFNWAQDVVHSAKDRHDRFCAFVHPLSRHAPLRTYGESLLAHQPPIPAQRAIRTSSSSFSVPIPQKWAIALKREWDGNPGGRKAQENKVRPLIGEWCDALIVGSHVGYGNDVFCTADQGKNAGANSLLFHGNRANLQSQGVSIMTPGQLVQHLKL